MTEQERIEAINSEQLVTATDRVLLASRFGRPRPSSSFSLQLARGSVPFLVAPARVVARGSSHDIGSHAISARRHGSHDLARGSACAITSPADDLTVLTRRPTHVRSAWRSLALPALVTSVLSVGAAIACLL